MTIAIETALQVYFLVPVIQMKIGGQIIETLLVVDSLQLFGSIDERAHLGLEGNENVMIRHREREVIAVLSIAGERAILGVATVRC